MAIKKSELYSKLWASCDELRGGMDASQYKDYVLALLFIKYISDKFAGQPYAPIVIPKGASFKDMVNLKGKSDIGSQINKKIIEPLAKQNKLSDMPDFDDDTKLGGQKEKVERLTNLIAIFEDKSLDFSKNRADGDDILGDAYEYLMRHFATESGKSKGQFYTPSEVSRIMAQILGIKKAKISAATTIYDPTCGSGSLLLKVGDEAHTKVTLYGQEKDATTGGLARMNMILHNNPLATIGGAGKSSIADPIFMDGNKLKQFDYVVANPPFSDKKWSTGLNPAKDPHERFAGFGVPPAKQGDYAFLLHIIRSLKSTGIGACILPHGVLFRGNAEAEIRKNLIQKKYIKGIIGLPSNLFYGTGIPACIIVLDKAGATNRKGIFLIDASNGYTKDGPKNRLRAQDIHKIVDVFNNQIEIPKFSRNISFDKIETNEFNLNLSRYIDSQKTEDIQDIDGHLQGGIPTADIDSLEAYWTVCPNVKESIFKELRPGYYQLTIDKVQIKKTIFEHKEFSNFTTHMSKHFEIWKQRNLKKLKSLKQSHKPKEIIAEIAEDILLHYEGQPLINAYDIYQHLMNYWESTMQDDCYIVSADGWKAETYRIIEKDKKGKDKDKGWTCDLIPKKFIVSRFYAEEKNDLDKLIFNFESLSSKIAELEEEHSGEEAIFSDFEKINKATVTARIKEIKDNKEFKDEMAILVEWMTLSDQESEIKKQVKDADIALDEKAYNRYKQLSENEIKTIVVEDKWLTSVEASVNNEMDRVSYTLTHRLKELAERYEASLPTLNKKVKSLDLVLDTHLKAMGFSW